MKNQPEQLKESKVVCHTNTIPGSCSYQYYIIYTASKVPGGPASISSGWPVHKVADTSLLLCARQNLGISSGCPEQNSKSGIFSSGCRVAPSRNHRVVFLKNQNCRIPLLHTIYHTSAKRINNRPNTSLIPVNQGHCTLSSLLSRAHLLQAAVARSSKREGTKGGRRG